MGYFEKLLDFFPSIGRLAFTVGHIALVLFLLPESVIDVDFFGQNLGINRLRDWIGIIAFAAIAIFIGDRLYAFGNWRFNEWKDDQNAKKERNRQIAQLHSLTREEREYLKSYIENEVHIQPFSWNIGAIVSLEEKDVIYKAGEPDQFGNSFYSIRSWAYEYLLKNKNIFDDVA